MTAYSVKSMGALLLAAMVLTGCHDREVERGPVLSETREVAEFDSISLRGSAQLLVKIGPERSLQVKGNDKALKRLTTEVNGNTLYINTSSRDFDFPGGSSRMVIQVVTPRLGELRVEGGNDVRLHGLDGGSSNIDIEGAAHLKADGRLDKLTVHMAGAGHADLKNLVANSARVTVDGVGSVYVNVTDSLDATMNGVGAILYSGSPREVNTSMNGVGTISRDRDRKQDSEEPDPDFDFDVEKDTTKPETEKPVDPNTLQPEYEKTDVVLKQTEVI